MINDLIYGGDKYKKDIKKLFPKGKIKDASDEVHDDRISLDVDLPEEEYFRKIILNGFYEMSLSALLYDVETIKEWMIIWKKDYPKYFKKES